MKRLVLIGGGHAHIEVLRELALNPDPQRHVTLVTPGQRLLYTGMVPGIIAGHYTVEDCAIDLGELARRADAELLLTTASLVSPDASRVACSDGSVVAYDVLSIDAGSAPLLGQVKGVERHAILVRPLDRALIGWNGVLARARSGEVRTVSLVGGGAGGIELALAMRHRFAAEIRGEAPHVRMITDDFGGGMGRGATSKLLAAMDRAGVECQVGSAVKEVGHGFVRLESGLEFATDATFWVTGSGAHPWIRDSGFTTDDRGFLLTNLRMQSVGYPNVFAAGDCASVEGHPTPKAGVFAVRAAPTLASNLLAALRGARLATHVPRPRYLALVSTGRKHAVAMRGGLSWQGGCMWWLKNRIDRRFVHRYREDPRVDAAR